MVLQEARERVRNRSTDSVTFGQAVQSLVLDMDSQKMLRSQLVSEQHMAKSPLLAKILWLSRQEIEAASGPFTSAELVAFSVLLPREENCFQEPTERNLSEWLRWMDSDFSSEARNRLVEHASEANLILLLRYFDLLGDGNKEWLLRCSSKFMVERKVSRPFTDHLTEALSQGLRSGAQAVILSAIDAAKNFVSKYDEIKNRLERLAHHPSPKVRRAALKL
ncbi:MAG: hypothetical protein HYW48_12180 [Deltaproteobacteria bacterium]|nr:hypothetical protein [Deltaproteobacteria bacterium]